MLCFGLTLNNHVMDFRPGSNSLQTMILDGLNGHIYNAGLTQS